ncbi:MAG: ADP-dependent glucokinase/phosphofructokinase [Candidatus Nanohaloarchaea archaeon]
MKEEWLKRYREITELDRRDSADVLVGFNANIDVKYDVDELELDFTDAEIKKPETISNEEELKEALLYCVKNETSMEIESDGFEFEGEGVEEIGGQAGIMSNYLSQFRNSVIFYTPFLSEELAEKIENKVLYPVYDEEFLLKNVRDAANTDRTKKNHIFEYEGDRTGRLIVSEKMKGFGPYFRKGVEENLETMDENLERVLFSGFQNIEGNMNAKLKKSEKQLEQIETPIHVEYVDMEQKLLDLVAERVFPHVDSLGFDDYEMRQLEEKLDLESKSEEGALGEAYQTSKELIERFELSRVHIHTYDFHLLVTREDYPVGPEKLRESMLFGELSAIKLAEKGEIPSREDLQGLDMEDKHLRKLDELEHFGDFFDLDGFGREGIAEIEGYNVVAIPPVIHEEPERLVGMGDVISSGTFMNEVKD